MSSSQGAARARQTLAPRGQQRLAAQEQHTNRQSAEARRADLLARMRARVQRQP